MVWDQEIAGSSPVYATNGGMLESVDKTDLKSVGYCSRVGSNPTSPTMKEIITNPHFYEDNKYDRTFEDLMDQAVGGIDKPKMHLWLPSSATQA